MITKLKEILSSKHQLVTVIIICVLMVLGMMAIVLNANQEDENIIGVNEPVVMTENVVVDLSTESVEPIQIEVKDPTILTLEAIEDSLKTREFKSKLRLKKDAVSLTINETEVLLSSMEDVKTVLESTVEVIIAPSHQLAVDITIEDNQMGEIKFTDNGEDSNDCEGELLSIEVIESVKIEAVSGYSNEILDVDQAVEFITKLKDTPQTYTVVSGDVPSVIAENNNMALSLLYEYNPELKNNATYMQIGDSLVVVVPKPELSLKVMEVDSYQTSIPKGYINQDDDSYYVGTNKTVEYGSDGIKEVTATIAKVNGNEISRSINGERTLQDPISAIIANGTKALPQKGSIGTFISPLVEYSLSSKFGPRWNRTHRGIDMSANTGTSVRASDGGVVSYSGWKGSYGYLVEIDHGNGIKTRYAHNSKLLVSVGETVSQYQEISKVGNTGNSTGPHLHFELLIDDVPVNPLEYVD